MSKVQLYVYEVTKGLAAQLSTALLGRYIPGVWHTAIVCYGMEYFFGSGGIENIHPGTTIVGRPDEIIELGETQITNEEFHEYLCNIGDNHFRPEKYHLFEHNCNTFSNEIAQFLTGRSIPSYILDLPNDVATTPMGAMLKTFMDGFGSPVGGRADHASRNFSRPQQAYTPAPSQPQRVQEASDKRCSPAASSPIIFRFQASECCKKLPELFAVDKEKLSLIESVVEGGKRHGYKTADVFQALYTVFDYLEQNNSTERFLLFIDLLSMVTVQNDCDVFKLTEGKELLDRVLKLLRVSESESAVIPNFLKLAANLYSEKERRDMFIAGNSFLSSDINKSCMAYCIESLTGENKFKEVESIAVSFAFNISLSEVSEETALELASALLHWISSAERGSETGKRCISALRNLAKSNDQITDLAAMTVDSDLLA